MAAVSPSPAWGGRRPCERSELASRVGGVSVRAVPTSTPPHPAALGLRPSFATLPTRGEAEPTRICAPGRPLHHASHGPLPRCAGEDANCGLLEIDQCSSCSAVDSAMNGADGWCGVSARSKACWRVMQAAYWVSRKWRTAVSSAGQVGAVSFAAAGTKRWPQSRKIERWWSSWARRERTKARQSARSRAARRASSMARGRVTTKSQVKVRRSTRQMAPEAAVERRDCDRG